jgi:hypothetical protein
VLLCPRFFCLRCIDDKNCWASKVPCDRCEKKFCTKAAEVQMDKAERYISVKGSRKTIHLGAEPIVESGRRDTTSNPEEEMPPYISISSIAI